MSCRIINNAQDDQAVLYCSCSDEAFGPVIMNEIEGSAYETAIQFCAWLEPKDPREFGQKALVSKYHEFLEYVRAHEGELIA